tara:strand:+ start:105 stop:506 length:402 start_codon:yes stop_codon:yes gene_type:complete
MTQEKKFLSTIHVPVSLGELIDKITILEIKKKHMKGKQQQNVEKELESLKLVLKSKNLDININLVDKLKTINNNLWEIEDQIRLKESKQEFNQEFIELARSVYKQNDQRSFIKREINKQYNSDLTEEKSYKNY